TNVGTQNNDLARTLAPTTEALILASATPHNGDPESFKEILRLLDPTSVMPDGTIDAHAAGRLIIHRYRNSPDVARVVGERWDPLNDARHMLDEDSKEGYAVVNELNNVLIQLGASNPVRDRLFPSILVKAFLYTTSALAETVAGRLKNSNDSN